MRRLIAPALNLVPALSLVLVASAGCAGESAGSGTSGAPADPGNGAPKEPSGKKTPNAEPGGGQPGGGDPNVVPPCPLNARQATLLVGQPMTDEGNCLFGDGKGVASLTITRASQSTGSATFDFARSHAEDRYGADKVKDADVADQAYLAVKDIEAEAVVVSPKGTYTVILSSFERLGAKPGAYEQTLRRILAAVVA
jgi:hypothetical protein